MIFEHGIAALSIPLSIPLLSEGSCLRPLPFSISAPPSSGRMSDDLAPPGKIGALCSFLTPFFRSSVLFLDLSPAQGIDSK